MIDLAAAVGEVARATRFSGVVRVDLPGEQPVLLAHGLADRAHGIAMTPDTRIAVASGGKTFTALTVLRLVEDGALGLDTRARDLLGPDLPLVDDAVTVRHLLAHRSGIGDYLDEASDAHDLDVPLMPVPVHTLDTAESYLAVLDGHPQVSAPGTRFAYNNGGYVVLALLAERAAGVGFHDLVRRHVLDRAGLTATAYLRSDALPGDAALGYLHAEGDPDELRTNVHHLPVVGGGDGGIFTTAADLRTLWTAVAAGAVVAPATWAEMARAHSVDEDGDGRGLGVALRGDAVLMTGADSGASFRSGRRSDGATWSVLANTTAGAWPVVGRLAEILAA